MICSHLFVCHLNAAMLVHYLVGLGAKISTGELILILILILSGITAKIRERKHTNTSCKQ